MADGLDDLPDKLRNSLSEVIYGRWDVVRLIERAAAEIDLLRSSLAAKDKALKNCRLAADHILAPVTMELGRYLSDAPATDLVPLLVEHKIKITGKQFRDLYEATGDRVLEGAAGDNDADPEPQKT